MSRLFSKSNLIKSGVASVVGILLVLALGWITLFYLNFSDYSFAQYSMVMPSLLAI